MRIPEKFYEMYNVQSIQIQEKFYSKKNDVIWIKTYDEKGQRKDVVVKQYKQSNWSCNKEEDILKHLKEAGLAVPEVYFKSNNLIIMEHIQGEVLLDTILRQENNMTEGPRAYPNQIVWELTHWLSNFYKIMKKWSKRDYVKGDMNLRNFIYGDKLYGIDFENSRTGYMEKDVGKLSAFILTYNPEFTQYRINFTNELIMSLREVLPLNEELAIQEMRLELNEISKRRNVQFSEESIELFIHNWRRHRKLYKSK